MADYQASETRTIAVGTSDTAEDFGARCSGCYLVSTADCYVAFDETADAGSLLIKSGIVYPLEKVSFQKVHAIRTGGAANLHILAVRT